MYGEKYNYICTYMAGAIFSGTNNEITNTIWQWNDKQKTLFISPKMAPAGAENT